MANQTPTAIAPSNGAGQSQAIVKGPQARLNTLKELFEKAKPNIAAVLPKHLTPERLIKIATSAASRNPELLDCTKESVLLAVVQAGTLGLEPNTPLHQCALVPYKNKHTGKKEAQLVVEYRGLCQLAYNSGEVESIYAHEIRTNDAWDVELGTNKRLFHKPCVTGDRGDVIAFYAVVKFKRGGTDFAFMTKAEVDEIRAQSPGANADAWVKYYVEMGKKSAIRRLSKTTPMSQDKAFAKALEIDERAESGQVQDYSDIVEVIGEVTDPETGEVSPANGAPAPASRTDAARERLQARAQ
jgi:recombination protein RecT